MKKEIKDMSWTELQAEIHITKILITQTNSESRKKLLDKRIKELNAESRRKDNFKAVEKKNEK